MLADLIPQLMKTTMQIVDGKVCSKCTTWKPNDSFFADAQKRRQRWCKECQKEYVKDWKRKTKEAA